MSDPKCEVEIESLNLDDLDVEELEHRLELAMTVAAAPEATDCPMLTSCGSLTTTTFDNSYMYLAPS